MIPERLCSHLSISVNSTQLQNQLGLPSVSRCSLSAHCQPHRLLPSPSIVLTGFCPKFLSCLRLLCLLFSFRHSYRLLYHFSFRVCLFFMLFSGGGVRGQGWFGYFGHAFEEVAVDILTLVVCVFIAAVSSRWQGSVLEKLSCNGTEAQEELTLTLTERASQAFSSNSHSHHLTFSSSQLLCSGSHYFCLFNYVFSLHLYVSHPCFLCLTCVSV